MSPAWGWEVLLPGLPPELLPAVPLLDCPPGCPPLEEGWFEVGEALEELVQLLRGVGGRKRRRGGSLLLVPNE